MERIEIFKDGENVWIKVPDDGTVLGILNLFLNADKISSADYLVPEEPEEAPTVPMEVMQQVFPIHEFVPVEPDSPLEVLQKSGPVKLGELYQDYAHLAKTKENPERMREIQKSIKIYVSSIAKDGFDASLYSLEETKEILKACEERVFADVLPQIYQQAGVASLESLFLCEEIIIKGALTACMNNLFKKVNK